MMFNKQQVVFLIGFLITLSGCWKPENDNYRADAAATFNVTSFEGKDETPNEARSSKWKIPTYKIMNYMACIEDRSTTNKARGQKFDIIDPVSGQTVASDLKTTNTSCMAWSEKLPYNYFAKQSYYVEMKRLIRGTGSHQGEREVIFYVNPWANDRDEKDTKVVIFRREGRVQAAKIAPQNMAAKALSGDLQERPKLWLSKLNVKITKSTLPKDLIRGAALSLEISFTPKVELLKSTGEVYWKEIQQGQFNVFSHLLVNDIGQDKGEKLILTKNARPALGRVIDGSVKIDQETIMSARVTDGRLEIALRVQAHDGPSTIEPFEGVYRMEQISKLVGSSSPSIKAEVIDPDKRFNMEEYLATASNFETLKASNHAMDMDPYTFTIAKPRYLKVGVGETATKRVVEYMVSTCVIDNIIGDNVGEKTQFVIEFANGQRQKIAAQSDGCLRWTSKLTHQYYEPETFFFENVKIYDESGKRLVGKKSFAINPWDDKFTFGWDRAEMEDKFFDDIQKRELIPSRFYIDQFSYHTLRFSYQIDKFMRLQVKKTILLELHPQVLRYSGIVGGRKVTEEVRDGIYVLKVAIQKDYLDPAETNVYVRNRRKNEFKTQKKEIEKKYYVDVVSKLVQVFDGHIITPIELSMSDLRLMRVRSQFLIQLETADEEKVQASNIVNEKLWDSLKRNRHSADDDIGLTEEDPKRKALEEEKKALKVERKKSITKLMQWLENKTVYDPEFIQQSGLSQKDYDTLLKRLAVNDFSTFDLAPITNPDFYLDKKSGLARRTFTGPMIFLSNAYSDSVRPTDSLTEVFCETNDCNYIEQDRREKGYSKESRGYEHNRYFGSVAHLFDTHVDDYILKKQELDKAYFDVMPSIASLGNYADSFNLMIASMKDETFFSIKLNCEFSSIENCQEPSSRQLKVGQLPLVLNPQHSNGQDLNLKLIYGTSSPVVLNIKNRAKQGHVFSKNEFEEIWKAPFLSQQHAEWVCHILAGRSSEDEELSYKLMRVYKDCLISYVRNPETFMIIDRKLRIGDTTGDYKFQGGKQMNLNVGSSFSVGHSTSTSLSSGIEAFDIISAIPFSETVAKWVKGIIKPLSIKYGSSESNSISDGTSVSEQTYLVMQMANFMVDLGSYERCMVLKPSNDWLKKVAAELYLDRKQGRNEPGYSEQLKTQGLMLCSGDMQKRTISVMESYFYFTQHFTEGDMLDQYDLYNHPWLLALRGIRDFTQFAKLLRKQTDKSYEWYNGLNPLSMLMGDVAKPWDKAVDKTGWPLDKMADTYRNTLPSFPGLYTLVHKDEFIQDYPWKIEETDPSFFSFPRDKEGKEQRYDPPIPEPINK